MTTHAEMPALAARLRVLHLTGSAVSDFMADLSRLYARDCLAALGDRDRYEPVLAYVGPDRMWRFPAGLDRAALADADPVPPSDAIARIAELNVDLAVPQMFCRPGMTEYRGLLDLLEIPYVGNTPDVMALTADKARAKAVVAAAGVAVPDGEVVHAGMPVTVAPPAVVKPVDGDNSLGVTLVRDRSRYDGAVAQACEHGSAALIERFVPLGREVRCATLVRDGELICLPLEEYAVDPGAKPIRDHADKIRRDPGGELALVAKDRAHAWIVDRDDPVVASVWAAARRCHDALGCRHYGLFDFRIDPDGRPWFLEAGLYCSFARQSVIAVMAAAAGIGIDELFAQCVSQALGTDRAVIA